MTIMLQFKQLILAGVFLLLAAVNLITTNLLNSRQVNPQKSFASGLAATLDLYWNGKAEWKLVRKIVLQDHLNWNSGFITHSQIYPAAGKWYLLSRVITPDANCPGENNVTVELRSSTDRGGTFSNPISMVTLVPGTPWECMATDGSLYFDKDNTKWIYLAQCLDKKGSWNGCLFVRRSTDPMGEFQPVSNNPVIKNGQLWNKICAPGTTCRGIVGNKWIGDEGTFDIIEKKSGYYYVSFHGYSNPYGFRGIAKTKDFVNWVTNDSDLPGDAILTKYDAQSWREAWQEDGNIGIGHSQTMKSGNYYYTIVEASDKGLECIDGQNWDLGLFRSTNYLKNTWTQLPLQNPIYYSSKNYQNLAASLPCNVSYGRLFGDDAGSTYMSVIRESKDWNYRGLFIYQLQQTGNLLINGDFWRCDAGWWQTSSSGTPTNRAVYRSPEKSTDANCYLATNCGSNSCASDQAIYQELSVPAGTTNVEFGIKARISQGTDGRGNLVLWEIGAKNVPHSIIITDLGQQYRSYSSTVTISPTTTKLYLDFYLLDGIDKVGDYGLDEAFVKIK